MPYYIYRLNGPKQLQYVDAKDKYQEAKALVRNLRAELGGDVESVRMVFAKSSGEAEKILSAPRDERVIGED